MVFTAPGPTLETERLILRPTAAADFEAWAAFMADEEVTRYLGGVQPRSVAWRGMLQVAGAWSVQGFSMFSVIEKATGRWVGRLGPWRPEGWPGSEVGWGLSRDAWGKGYAMEGAVASIDWAFDHLGWTDVIHSIESGNLASRRVAERLGSVIVRSEPLPAPYQDHLVDIWFQTREEWRSRRAGLPFAAASIRAG
ncbi:MAG: GNAT family N-acetyltransferase [Proteobacteria bacterium]|nr:GNAT family N-acetyltransferase [Pseudomonadota bacterium]